LQKTILGHHDHPAASSGDEWFGIEAIAGIEVTSEDDDAPVENVFSAQGETGWRAADPGPQIIRITFNEPRSIRRIQLIFRESRFERTQEFTLSCGVASGERRELIRQQWTFSPHGSTQEVEDYHVPLNDVIVLEFTINPDINNGGAHASLVRLRIG
jgi:hypothetical protein